MADLSKENIRYIIALVVVVIILVIYFNDDYRTKIANYFNPKPTSKDTEHLGELKEVKEIRRIEATPEEKLQSLGYDEGVSWMDAAAAEDLDESVFASQRDYIKDVTRFSSGANFTSVADDNTNAAFNNFVGLRRPQPVFIGSTARQQPDLDQTVLMRNPDFRFMGCDVNFKHY